MNISRSGYYKWLKNKDILNRYEINRRDLEPLIKDIHKRKPSYGYHRINVIIRRKTGWVVSDNLKFKKQRFDWTYYVDAFDDSIIGSDVKPFYHGVSISNHISALNDMLNNKIKRGYKGQETIFHSDQGTIYSSVAFNNAHKDYNIIRSMSRIGTPTDNPIIESKNGWLKKEMYIDFNQDDFETVEDYINAIIYDHNYLRPSYALNYKTP